MLCFLSFIDAMPVLMGRPIQVKMFIIVSEIFVVFFYLPNGRISLDTRAQMLAAACFRACAVQAYNINCTPVLKIDANHVTKSLRPEWNLLERNLILNVIFIYGPCVLFKVRVQYSFWVIWKSPLQRISHVTCQGSGELTIAYPFPPPFSTQLPFPPVMLLHSTTHQLRT